MRFRVIDADADIASGIPRLARSGDPEVEIMMAPPDLDAALADVDAIIVDATNIPTAAVAAHPRLRHIIFLGTGARSFMDVDALEAIGVSVHIITGYGDTAVAEHAIALMWDAARKTARMDGGIRAGGFPRFEGLQLTGRTLGLLGFGGIAREVARIAGGGGMRVLAWNRTPRAAPGVHMVDLDTLLAESDVLSLHLLLTDETRGFLDAARIAKMRPGAILVNTARGAVVDEAAMIAALRSGHLSHAALDVFDIEPLPPGHPLTRLPNTTLTGHSAFKTAEAADNLLLGALDHARRLAG
jgi:D-3-phosphoglycerate dehydrogenase